MAKVKAKPKTQKNKAGRETDKLVKLLQLWQEIEKKSIESTADIIKKTDNPLVRQADGDHPQRLHAASSGAAVPGGHPDPQVGVPDP